MVSDLYKKEKYNERNSNNNNSYSVRFYITNYTTHNPVQHNVIKITGLLTQSEGVLHCSRRSSGIETRLVCHFL